MSTKTLIFLLISSIVLQLHKGVVETRTARIVGGRPVHIEQIPYMISVHRKGSFSCGGSLITPKCVLTAAHCVHKNKLRDMNVLGGVTFLNEHSHKRAVKNIFISKTFNKISFDSDVAIFELYSPLKGKFMQSIELANEAPQEGDFVKVSGWGLTHENGTISQQLRSVYVAVESHKNCQILYKDFRNVTKNMFCASIPGIKDACLGDSGGPVVFDNKLVGIVSWGRRSECARKNSPGVYVNIPAIRPWIDKIMGKHCY